MNKVKPIVLAIRQNICRGCPHQCQGYLDKTLDLENAESFCPVDWKSCWHATKPSQEQINKTNFNYIAQEAIKQKNLAYSQLWAELHLRALKYIGVNDQEWFDQFCDKVPQFGCNCRGHWKDLVKQHPPDWNNYFDYTVMMHNLVNQKLKKSIVEIEEARNIWMSKS